MNIKATTKMDLDTMKALTKITMFGKRNAIKRMLTFTVIYALIIALEMWSIITFEVRATNVLILVIATVAITINPLLYFTMPKLNYKKLGKLRDSINEYVFTDEGFTETVIGDGVSGNANIDYSVIQKIYESNDYFYLFNTNRSAYIIDKRSIENKDDIIQLENLLYKKVPNYTRCNY